MAREVAGADKAIWRRLGGYTGVTTIPGGYETPIDVQYHQPMIRLLSYSKYMAVAYLDRKL